jgi:soluble lytic murein transglycosylase-like protein
MMENLYVSAGACLTSDDVAYETLHSRMGFLYMERNEFQKAANALFRASKAERPLDETRVRFWLGFLTALKHYEGDGKFSPHKNLWWESLEQSQPLSLHSVAARHLLGRASDELLKASQTPTLAIYQGDKWNARNYWAFLMVLAKSLHDKDMMKDLAKIQSSHLRMADFHDALFYSIAQREAGEKKASFRAVQSGVRSFGANSMSKNVLSLLFPLHYLDEINAVEQCRDPALVLALIRQESSFEEDVVSYRGASGLMQILPNVARDRLKKENVDLTKAADNIKAGCLQLDAMMREFENE